MESTIEHTFPGTHKQLLSQKRVAYSKVGQEHKWPMMEDGHASISPIINVAQVLTTRKSRQPFEFPWHTENYYNCKKHHFLESMKERCKTNKTIGKDL